MYIPIMSPGLSSFIYTSPCIAIYPWLHTYMRACTYTCRFLGNGLLTVRNYSDWSPRRRLYDPAFTKRLTNRVSMHVALLAHNTSCHVIINSCVAFYILLHGTILQKRCYDVILRHSPVCRYLMCGTVVTT